MTRTGHKTIGRAVSAVPPAEAMCAPPAGRVLLVGSTADRFGGVAEPLASLRMLVGPGRVLVVRPAERAGVERAGAKLWRLLGGAVEHVDDPLASVSSAEVAVLACGHLDPYVLAAVVACEDAEVPVLLHAVGRYPYRPGTAQAEGATQAQRARVAAVARRRVLKRAA